MSSNEHSLTAADDPAAPLSTSRACDALPAQRGFREGPAEAVDDPSESCWLKEAKAALRAPDPGEASEDASALSRWADRASHARQARWAYLRWREIIDAEEAALRNYYNLGYYVDD